MSRLWKPVAASRTLPTLDRDSVHAPDHGTLVLAEDDEDVTRHLKPVLERHGYTVHTAEDGLEALRLTRQFRPDVLILDLVMPRLDGREVCRRLRALNDDTPILIVTEILDAGEAVSSFAEGANDYIRKPFDASELVARIRAHTRHTRVSAEREWTRLVADGIQLDRLRRTVAVNGQEVALTPKAFSVLQFLMVNGGHFVSRAVLLERVWKLEPDSGEFFERRVDRQVTNLRTLLDPVDPNRFIETRYGVGYRFKSPVEARV